MGTPDLKADAEFLNSVITQIREGKIRIPNFQRSYVWKQQQAIKLLDSIAKNYPIGSILLWETKYKMKEAKNVGVYRLPNLPKKSSEEFSYVIDGQQRLVSAFGILGQSIQADCKKQTVFYDLDAKMFFGLSKSNNIQDSGNIIIINNFLNLKNFLALCKKHSSHRDELERLYDVFQNYKIPIVTLKNRSRSDALVIFERINNTGTKLNPIEIVIALTSTDNFHLGSGFTDLKNELEQKNFGKIKDNILLQALAGVIQGDVVTAKIIESFDSKVEKDWKKFTESIKKAVDFLCGEIGCVNYDYLPYPQQLVALCKFFSERKRPSAAQIQYLKQWFWRTSFSDRYSTGMTTEKMNEDIQAIIGISKNKFTLLKKYRANVTKDDLLEKKFSRANPLTRAFLLLLALQKPRDLVKNTRIDVGEALAHSNKKEYHHVFPQKYLKGIEYENSEISRMLNYCFLSADSNKQISKRKPSDYFFNLIPQEYFNEILESNLLPTVRETYRKNNYIGKNSFLDKRADIVLKKIKEISR